MQCTRWNIVHSPPSIWSPIWSWSYYELLSSLDLFVLEFLSLSSNEIIPFNLKSSTIPEFDQLEPLIPGWRDGKKSCWGKGKWNQGAKGKISESQSRLKFVCPILPADYLKDLFTGVQHSGHNYTPIYLWNGPKIYNLNQIPGAREGQQEAAEGAGVYARGGRTGWRCRCDLAFEPDASANLMNIGFGLVC